ncbi:MAG: DUF3378 domain-containing protein [Candidatus Diapherotrites archaeon]|nr:DUF3378 domain-containing protein [Candidatus Micrarchaeota archaeon]MBU1939720.1 DUF3378 domain-containing protein [Candidatus Micrarchaeota archaeon]
MSAKKISPCMLNFSPAEIGGLKKCLARFAPAETKTKYEALRAKTGGTTITLYTSGKLVIQGPDCGKVKDALLAEFGAKSELVLGIDETGRGEATGPLVICGVLGETSKLRELRDSKKTKNMAGKYALATKNSLANFTISIGAEMVSLLRERGINLNQMQEKSIDAIACLFSELSPDAKVRVDGSALKVCTKGIEFIPKGDDKEPVIGAASVIAKHVRNISGDATKRRNWGAHKG